MDAENKAQIRSQWLSYETRDASSLPKTRNYQMMYDRMADLAYQYKSSGWDVYNTLEDAAWMFQLAGTYNDILNMANMYGSPPEFTIVALKDVSTHTYVAPMITTKWHQDPPYNDFCPTDHLGRKYDAGCAAIAMAMVLKHHRYSASPITWNGHTVIWNDLLDDTYYDNNGCLNTTNSVKALIKHAADKASMNWGFGIFGTFSWALPGNVTNGLRSYGYTVNQVNSHSYTTVRNELVNNGRPVLMLGGSMNLIPPLSYIGNGHYWVCDGVNEYSTKYQYFIEFFTGSGYSTYSYCPPSNPGNTSTIGGFAYLRMNWGWKNHSLNSWYYDNQFPSGHNFQHDRKNYYISK